MTYLSEITYGGIDGIITTTAVIAGSMGIGLQPHVIIVLALSSMIADGISMAVGSYQSEMTRPYQKNKYVVMWMTFFSFIFFGSFTILPFVFSHVYKEYQPNKLHVLFIAACVLFFIGSLRGKRQNKKFYISGLETMTLGVITSIVAYYIAKSTQ
jgi:VIT1/CCC1 family predicted Fe2+/Mn2+ transporter